MKSAPDPSEVPAAAAPPYRRFARPVDRSSMLLDAVFVLAAAGAASAYAVVHATTPAFATIPPPVFLPCFLVVCVLWWWLPWERGAPLPGRARSALFAALALPIGFDAAGEIILLALAVANVVMVFGIAAGVLEAGLTILLTAVAYVHGGLATGLSLHLLGAAATFHATVIAAAELFRRNRDQQRATRRLLGELASRNADLEAARAALQRSHRSVRDLTVAAERGRFARDMHDTVGHHLVAIRMSLRRAMTAAGDDAEIREAVTAAADEAAAALEETRRTVRGLRPSAMDQRLDEDGLRSLTDAFTSDGLAVSLEVAGDLELLGVDVALLVYRTVQEGMTNLVKHSDASRATVYVSIGDGVSVTVRDNGSVLATPVPTMSTVCPDRPFPVSGVGLRGLGERADVLSGTLTAGSVRDGFELTVAIPGVRVRKNPT